jgi:arsenate reductase
MAEGLARNLKADIFEAHSAGIEAHGRNPYAVQVMKEIGIDITGQRSKTTAEIANKFFDYVITLCSHADENCPIFPAKIKVMHHGFDDPPKLALTCPTEEEKLQCYRRVRDEIQQYILTLPESLP